MLWTKVEEGTRRIVSSGRTPQPPELAGNQRLIEGVRGDARTQRAAIGYQELEDKTPLPVTTNPSPAVVGVGEPLELSAPEPFAIHADGDGFGELEAGTIAFEEEGTWALRLTPSQAGTTVYLPAELEVTVTAGGTPAPADLKVGERRRSLRQAVRTRLALFDAGNDRAEIRRQAAADLADNATTPITNLAEARAVLRTLATLVEETNRDQARGFRYIRRGMQALVDLIARREPRGER